MQNYVQVDVFGKCEESKCPGSIKNEFILFEFLKIAFEETI